MKNGYIMIYGDPPYCLFYRIKDKIIGIDLVLIRPDPLEYLIPNKKYDAEFYLHKNKLYKIKTQNIIFTII